MNIRLLLFLFWSTSSPFLSQVEAQSTDSVTFFHKNLKNKEIREGQIFLLRSIRFKLNSDTLDQSSYPELLQLDSFLIKYPSVKIRLEAYTGPSNDTNYVINLSESRASVIKKYLINKGIDENRIKIFGGIAKYDLSCTEGGNIYTRKRTQMRIISK